MYTVKSNLNTPKTFRVGLIGKHGGSKNKVLGSTSLRCYQGISVIASGRIEVQPGIDQYMFCTAWLFINDAIA